MKRAAGTILLAETTGRTLLLKRADGSGWGHPGGWSEPGEEPEETAQRELDEETGFPAILTEPILSFDVGRARAGFVRVLPEGMTVAAPRTVQTVLVYTVFVVTVREEFVPTLNDEHTDWKWVRVTCRTGLHPGAAAALDEILQRSEENA